MGEKKASITELSGCLRNHKMANMTGQSRQDVVMVGAVRAMRDMIRKQWSARPQTPMVSFFLFLSEMRSTGQF